MISAIEPLCDADLDFSSGGIAGNCRVGVVAQHPSYGPPNRLISVWYHQANPHPNVKNALPVQDNYRNAVHGEEHTTLHLILKVFLTTPRHAQQRLQVIPRLTNGRPVAGE